MAKKQKQKGKDPTGSEWLATYSDMITLLMCFFVIMFNPDDITQVQIDSITASMRPGGLGAMAGGLTLQTGRSAELGNTIMSLPSMERGRSLGTALRKAISVFSPEIRSNKVRITHDERGVVITLASDAFFPMNDTVEAAAKAGITAIIQPGGSIKDVDSIKKADEYGIAMIFTGMRHFKH